MAEVLGDKENTLPCAWTIHESAGLQIAVMDRQNNLSTVTTID